MICYPISQGKMSIMCKFSVLAHILHGPMTSWQSLLRSAKSTPIDDESGPYVLRLLARQKNPNA
jgi:hypothetical protein